MKPPEFSTLIVDDDEMVRTVLARSVRMFANDVEVASDGRHATVLLGQRHFDLVISDLRMPGMTGLELAGFLREQHPRTRMLVVTGFTRKHEEQRLLELGIAVLHKPFGPEELRRAILRVLEIAEDPAT